MHVVAQDGSRVEATLPAQQQHFTAAPAPEAEWTLERWFFGTPRDDGSRQSDGQRSRMIAEGLSSDRIGQYETYLSRWDRCCREHWRSYPVLRAISPATLLEFRTWLISEKVTSGAAADKHIAGISTLLRRAEQAWILPRVPTLKAAGGGKSAGLKFTFPMADVGAMHAAAASFGVGELWPLAYADGRPCDDPGLWWQGYFEGGWNFGFRTQEWWSYEAKMSPLVWPGVIFDTKIEIEGREYENADGWATWTQDKTDHNVILPLNSTLNRMFRRLWGKLTQRQQRAAVSGDGRRVWDFALTAGTNKPGKPATSVSGFYGAYWAIVERAGIAPKRNAKGERATHRPSHFRKTAHTLHRDRIGNAADWITGHHGGKSVAERHYYVAVEKVRKSILEHEQPPSFLESD